MSQQSTNEQMNERTVAVYRTATRKTDEFTVPYNERTTIIDALEYIRLQEDPDLMYRQSCHHGSCGTCGVAVNGEFVLACIKRLADIPEDQPVRIEPLPTMHQIGDLAFDPAEFFNEFPEDITYIRSSEVNSDAAVPSDMERYERFEDCIECGLCVTSCPVEEDWMGPAALASIHRMVEKEPDQADRWLDLAADARGVERCAKNFSCSRVCPTGVAPGKRITLLGSAIKKRAKAQASGENET